jgi:hypothetical protein
MEKKKRPYTKVVAYHFEVQGESLAITNIGKDHIYIEDTRKNGQEDTHMFGVLLLTCGGTYIWEDEDNMFVRYHSKELANEIRRYVNKHGCPGRKKPCQLK